MNRIFHFVIILLLLFLSSCSSKKEKKDTSELWSKAMTTGEIIKRSGTKLTTQKQREAGVTEADAKNRLISGGGLMGNKPISLTGGNTEKQVAGIGMPINPYLWRASLEATSFMPLSSADPFGGTIITEWYNDNANLDNLIYSLQLSASSSLDEIKGKKIFYSKKLKNSQNQLFIVKFDSSLGPYFLLLYMNFTTRDSAKILCDDLKTKDINCLIVNVKNL